MLKFAAVAAIAASIGVVGSPSVDAAGTWSAARQLSPGFGVFPHAGMDARGDAVVAFESYARNAYGGPATGTTRLMLAERRAGHAFGRAHQVGRTGSFTLVQLAENPAGAVAILFRGPRTLELLYRAAGGHFGRAERVSENFAPVPSPVLALDRRGGVTVAWEDTRRRDVRVSSRPPHGHLAHAQRLGRRGSKYPDLSVNGRGDAVVAWAQPSGRSTSHGTPLFDVRAAFRSAGGSRFGRSERVSPPVEISQVLAAEGPVGDSFVGWVAFGSPAPGPTHMTVPDLSIAHRGSRGRFGAAQLIGRADTPATLVSAPSGAAVVHWDRVMCSTPCPTPNDVHFDPVASFRRPGRRFGPVVDAGVQDAGAAIEPEANGRWLAALFRMERGGPDHGVLAATAGPGGTFSSPSPVTNEAAYGGSLATDSRGDAVVAWNANGEDSRVHAAIRGR